MTRITRQCTIRGVISAFLLVAAQAQAQTQAFGALKLHYFQPPPVTAMPGGTIGALVRQGYDIFKDTPKYAPRYAGNGLSCGSCHLDNGRKPNAIPMWGAAGLYPKYEPRVHQVITLSQRVQQCFVSSLHGYVPPRDSETLLALESYISWLATGAPERTLLPGARLPVMPRTGKQPDPVAGRQLFAADCSMCHGKTGQGLRDKSGKYIYPPLWGNNSFAWGAGMGRQLLLERFILANMPFDNPGSLKPQQAKDIAAWIRLQWRDPNPRRGILGWLP
jgi:thiosulfate dehydrogenase